MLRGKRVTLREMTRAFFGRTPISMVPLAWDELGYTTESFNAQAAAPGFVGWPGDVADEEEAEVIVSSLGCERGAALLDVACGFGRHTQLLAGRHGLTMTGIDISPGLITCARRRAAESGLKIEYTVGDARELKMEEAFDGVLIGYNTISVFSPTDVGRVLAGVLRAMKAEGRFFIDLDNKPYNCRYGTSITDWSLFRWGLKFQEVYFHADVSVEVQRDTYVDFAGRNISEFVVLKRIYSVDDISRLLAEHGFRILSLHGGWDLKPVGPDSPKILVTAAKA